MIIRIKRLKEGARTPLYATAGAAGLDLYSCLKEPMILAPGSIVLVPTGIAAAIPQGYVGLIRDRSGLALAGFQTVAGVIDSDYRGEILIAGYYVGKDEMVINDGERIAQMIILPSPQAEIVEVDELSPTDRGAGGFGSTGR